MWLAYLEKLKTGDKLVEKGIIEPQHALCPFCSLEMESNSHILFSCMFSWSIWMHILEWWGIKGVLQINCDSFGMEWCGLMKIKRWKKLWNLIFGCVIWSIWFERNKVKFEMKVPNLQLFTYSLMIRIRSWAKECLGYAGISQHDLIHNLKAVLS